MTLDLDELTLGWDCPVGEMRARIIVGRDGDEVLQVRLDLGVMQMTLTERPDGRRYRGLPTTADFIEHELRVGSEQVTDADWRELQREMQQHNYRRLAYCTLAEDALNDNDRVAICRYIGGALDDTRACLRRIKLADHHGPANLVSTSLQPTLLFDQARLLSQLQVVEGHFEDAIENAETGADQLDELLAALGYDEEQREDDPGVRYLLDLGRQLRLEYGISQTLRERLQQALDDEDFETAAELRDKLAQRSAPDGPDADPPVAE